MISALAVTVYLISLIGCIGFVIAELGHMDDCINRKKPLGDFDESPNGINQGFLIFIGGFGIYPIINTGILIFLILNTIHHRSEKKN